MLFCWGQICISAIQIAVCISPLRVQSAFRVTQTQIRNAKQLDPWKIMSPLRISIWISNENLLSKSMAQNGTMWKMNFSGDAWTLQRQIWYCSWFKGMWFGARLLWVRSTIGKHKFVSAMSLEFDFRVKLVIFSLSSSSSSSEYKSLVSFNLFFAGPNFFIKCR